jgi:hypothetical protein
VAPPCRAGAPGDTRIRGNHRRPGDASPTHNIFTVLAVAWIAAPAQAQWIVTTYVRINVAGDLETRRGGAGVFAGYIGDWVGFEFDVERHGHFFKDAEIGNTGNSFTEDVNTRATRIMGNALVPLHRRGATGWRLYARPGLV